jgi:hypothetical protein
VAGSRSGHRKTSCIAASDKIGACVPCSKGERVAGEREEVGGSGDNAVSCKLLVHLHKMSVPSRNQEFRISHGLFAISAVISESTLYYINIAAYCLRTRRVIYFIYITS